MKLFGKKEWIISVFGLGLGLILTGILLKVHFGVINFWVIGIIGLLGFLIIHFIGKYANK